MEPIPLEDQHLQEGRATVARVAAFTVTEAVAEALRALSVSCLPDEACGLLVGPSTQRADELLVMQNVHEPPRLRRYRIDPLAYAEAEDRADAAGKRIVGIFHSHPPAPAVPSQFDLDGALPGLWYVIHGYPFDPEQADAGPERPERPERHRDELRVWVLSADGGRFIEAPLIISSEEQP